MTTGPVLPVGFRLGAETVPDPVAGSVRLGWRRLGLDAAQATTWDLAHGLLDDDPARSGELLIERAAAAGVPDPAAVVAALVERSLLVQVPPAGPALLATAAGLRARPLLLGLGVGEDGTTSVLGLPGWPVLELPPPVVTRWEDTAVSPDLRTAAELAVLRAWDLAHPDATDPDAAPTPTDDQVLAELSGIVADLSALITRHCGYLDLADPGA
ncbi:hypothetical protein SAMN05660199_04130 [Klenkia soli]|uniref:Uncharacterized protein n=1 Tax=Klenkia soli TaxID=1052260 RepID=A0A1H0TF38_9ACTN|nr:hypothetical protein [Klenkia soli]SDP52441.1 hypothetical protein SAMN05660199_04130 [Klenkia soli]